MARSKSLASTPLSPPAFASELEQVIEPVRAAFRRLIADFGSPATAADFDRLTGAGATICWQVFRVANSADPVAEARNVPTPTSLKKLLAAASAAGVPASTLEAVDAAARAFRDFSKRAASDRTAFDSMLAGVAPEQSVEKIPVSLRRTSARALSSIAGIQVDQLYFASIVRATPANPGHFDQITLHTHTGLRRLRPDANLFLYGYQRNSPESPSDPNPNPDATSAPITEAPLDKAAFKKHGMPILPDFSSNPLPLVERIDHHSSSYYRVVSNEVGLRSSTDAAFARISRNNPYTRDTDDRLLFYSSYVTARSGPELGIHELILHRPSFPHVHVDHMLFHSHVGSNVSHADARASQQYPVEPKLQKIGRADVATNPDVPRYQELLAYTFSKANWNPSEFDIYRFRMPYPIAFSTDRIFFYVT